MKQHRNDKTEEIEKENKVVVGDGTADKKVKRRPREKR